MNRQMRLETKARTNQSNEAVKNSEPITIFHHKKKVCAIQENISLKHQQKLLIL
jgi:hypothetical protein